MSRPTPNPEPPPLFAHVAWWLLTAPDRLRNAIGRTLHPDAPLVPESAAAAMAVGLVVVAAVGEWPLLLLYAGACTTAVAAARAQVGRR